jgi:hypothetical protein
LNRKKQRQQREDKQGQPSRDLASDQPDDIDDASLGDARDEEGAVVPNRAIAWVASTALALVSPSPFRPVPASSDAAGTSTDSR